MSKNLVLWIATQYRDAGLSVIPIRLDGSKSPALPAWNAFRDRLCRDSELSQWFALPRGIGIVCGVISGGLEVLDFDDGSLFPAWFALVQPIASKLTIIATAGGGFHVMFRCESIGGNVKIACDPSREKQTLIETRGEGGYIVAHGSPRGVHSSGKAYDIDDRSGCYLPTVPTITPDERRELWKAARTFDLRPEVDRAKLIAKYRKTKSDNSDNVTNNGSLHPVVAAFCNRKTWFDILEPHGWTTTDGIHWCRPEKRFGVSAKVALANDGMEVLTVFSGNAGPLSPSGSHRSVNRFDAWALLQHGGDNRAAFAAARQEVAA